MFAAQLHTNIYSKKTKKQKYINCVCFSYFETNALANATLYYALSYHIFSLSRRSKLKKAARIFPRFIYIHQNVILQVQRHSSQWKIIIKKRVVDFLCMTCIERFFSMQFENKCECKCNLIVHFNCIDFEMSVTLIYYSCILLFVLMIFY